MKRSAQAMVLGTRGSELALTQTRMVQERLRQAGFEHPIEVRIIQTTGDRRQDLRLAAPELDKAVFTKELEEALCAGEIDAAVHSLKDVPTLLDARCELAAVLPRAPVEDVLITKVPGHAAQGLASLPPGAVVATSSLRRAYQLRRHRPDLSTVDIRGNVPTRLRKVAELEEIDATILARAGLERLGFPLQGSTLELEGGKTVGIHVLPPTLLLPAASQGAIALEIRAGDSATAAILRRINDDPTWNRIRMERAFLAAIGAGCQTPVGIYTQLEEDGATLAAEAIVFEITGENPRCGRIKGPAAASEQLARELSEDLS